MSANPNAPALANGNGKILWWLLGLLTTGAAGISTSVLHTVQDNTSRIAVVESQYQETRRRLERIESKLDRIITHEQRRNDHGPDRLD